MDASVQTFWDPINDRITAASFQDNLVKLDKKVQKYRNNPYLFIVQGIIILAISLAFILFTLFFFFQLFFYSCFIAGFLIIGYYVTVRKLQEEIIYFLVCSENQWAYNPSHDNDRAEKCATAYSDIFQKGYDRYLSDQIWGTVQDMDQAIPFWRCDFTYTEGSGKSSHTYTEPIIAIQFKKALPIQFTLQKASFFNRLGETIKTESDEFNKQFLIIANDSSLQTKEAVMRVLTPSVQVRLIEFSKQYPINSLVFSGDLMILELGSAIWQPKYTSIFKQTKIDPRDIVQLNQTIQDVAEIPAEMIQYIQ